MEEQDAQDMLRLIETVKYLIGIAERGEGRQIRDNETAEQFVLGYVRRLENALRMAADEPNIDKARAIADAVLVPNAELCGGPSGPSERAPGYASAQETEGLHAPPD